MLHFSVFTSHLCFCHFSCNQLWSLCITLVYLSPPLFFSSLQLVDCTASHLQSVSILVVVPSHLLFSPLSMHGYSTLALPHLLSQCHGIFFFFQERHKHGSVFIGGASTLHLHICPLFLLSLIPLIEFSISSSPLSPLNTWCHKFYITVAFDCSLAHTSPIHRFLW